MAFGSIEIVSITRTQDYTTIKQNQDNKGTTDQLNFGQQLQKETNRKSQEVRSGDDSDWKNKKFDAKEKSENEYCGDGGHKRRKHKEQEQVVIKGHKGFDMKI